MDLISHRFEGYANRPEWESALLSNYHYVLIKKKKKKKKKSGSLEFSAINTNDNTDSSVNAG